MRFRALWQRTPLAGLMNSAFYAAHGARLHPSVRILGNSAGLRVERGAKIGAGNVLNLIGPSSTIRIGRGVWTYRGVELHAGRRIEICDGVSLQRHVLINGDVSIGRGCILAPRVYMSSAKHVYDLKPDWTIRAQEALLASGAFDADIPEYVSDRLVQIDEDCWIGGNVFVAPGVRIGRGAIVGVNSVVTRNVAPYAIVAGAPARPIRARLAWRPPVGLDATRPEARAYLYSGFDVEDRGAAIVARAIGEASVALQAPARSVFEARFVASGAGALEAFGRTQAFGPGEQRLRWTDVAPWAEVFAETLIVPLRFSFEAAGASVQFLGCDFSEG